MNFKLIIPICLGTICTMHASNEAPSPQKQQSDSPLVLEQQPLPPQLDIQNIQIEIDQNKAAFLRTNCPKFKIDRENGLHILEAVLLEPTEFDSIFNQKTDIQQILFTGMATKRILPQPIQNYADSLLQNQTQNNNQQNTSITTSLNDDFSSNLSNHEDNQNDNKSSMLQEGSQPEISVLDDEQITNNNQQNATMDDLFGFIKAAYEFSRKISSTTGTLAGYFLAGLLAGGTAVAIAINPKAAKRAVIQTGKGIIHAGKSAAHGIGNLVSTGAKALWQKIPGKAVTQAAVDLAANTASKAAEGAAVAAATVVVNTLK